MTVPQSAIAEHMRKTRSLMQFHIRRDIRIGKPHDPRNTSPTILPRSPNLRCQLCPNTALPPRIVQATVIHSLADVPCERFLCASSSRCGPPRGLTSRQLQSMKPLRARNCWPPDRSEEYTSEL